LAYRKVRQRRVAKSLMIDTPNGIVEKRYVRIGGIEQWIQIRGENRTNPVLLVVHGGPGWPNATFTLPLRSWEKHFTVVQWDQRGVSKTLGRNGKAGSGEMTFERRVFDAIELTEFLRNHLRKDKVILLAESMGTLVGVPLVKRRPDLFYAYVGTDQYVDMARNEALKYQMTLERLRAAGNDKGVAALEKIGPDPSRWDLGDWNVNMAWAFKTNIPHPPRHLLFVRRLPIRHSPTVRGDHVLRRSEAGHQLRGPVLHLSGRDRCGDSDQPGRGVLHRSGGANQGARTYQGRRTLRRVHPT
jgi:pimeloyl-ACP methyl ester carboxylesterase